MFEPTPRLKHFQDIKAKERERAVYKKNICDQFRAANPTATPVQIEYMFNQFQKEKQARTIVMRNNHGKQYNVKVQKIG